MSLRPILRRMGSAVVDKTRIGRKPSKVIRPMISPPLAAILSGQEPALDLDGTAPRKRLRRLLKREQGDQSTGIRCALA